MKQRLGVTILFVVVLLLVVAGHAPGKVAIAQTLHVTTQQSGSASAISAGYEHSCALTTGGGVKCWGSNLAGQLGDGTATDRYTPVDVVGLGSGVNAIATGDGHTCALTTGGGVKCWGGNGVGQLGDGTRTARLLPVDVVGLGSGVNAVVAGGYHTCGLTTGGGVKCWGWNSNGHLGDGTDTVRLIPVDVVGLGSGVSAIAAGREHTCALTTGGGVKCWGDNGYGQLGDGTATDRYTPVDVVGLGSGMSAISAGGYHTCGLTTGGGVKCWGDNGYGQLGDGTTTPRISPVDVAGLGSSVIVISAGNDYTCALTTGGGVKCWGHNGGGQLGDGTTTHRHMPVDVVDLANGVSAISAGINHTCVLTAGGGVKCWGHNGGGQLGDGTTNPSLTPISVVGLESSSANLILKLRVEDAPDGVQVRKSRGSYVDIVAKLTGDQASEVSATLEVTGDRLGAPIGGIIRDHAGDGGQEVSPLGLGSGRYQIETALEELPRDNQTVYYQEAVWRFQVPDDAAYGDILLNVTADDSAGSVTDSASFGVVDYGNAIVVTSRVGLFREYGQGKQWSNVEALLQEVYRAAAQETGEVFYIERYGVDWTQTTNEYDANFTVEEQVDPLVEQWHATLTSDSLAFLRPEYLLIIGGDEVIPFYRADDDDYNLFCAPVITDCEKDWADGLAHHGVLWDAYDDNYFLTDNIYADVGGDKQDWENGDLELALGRIVGSNAVEMRNFIRSGSAASAPLAQGGLSSVWGSDVDDMKTTLTGAGVSLLGVSNPDLTENNSWTPSQFIGEWDKNWQFFYVGSHGSPIALEAPEADQSGGGDKAIPLSSTSSIQTNHPLVLMGACNAAVPVPQDLGLANKMAEYGFSGIVGSTGLVRANLIPFGMMWGGEKLDNLFVQELLRGDQTTVRFGEALRRAKRDFNPTNLTGRKTMLEYVYYGLPWAYMDIAGAGGSQVIRQQSNTVRGNMQPASIQAAATNGSYQVIVSAGVASYTLEQVEGYDLLVVDGAEIVADPAWPALPFVVKSVTLPAGSTVESLSLAGENAVSLGAKALPALTPVTTYDTTSGVAAFTGTGVHPAQRWSYQVVDGPDHMVVEILIYLASLDADTQELTLFDSTDLQLNYTPATSAVLENLELNQKSYLPGDTVQAAAEVQNVTDQSRSYTARLTLLDADDTIISETESTVFSVPSGGSQQVTVNSTAVDAAGAHLALLSVLEAGNPVASDKESFTVSDGAVIDFQAPAEAEQGVDSEIVLTFRNYRQEAVEVSAEIKILDLGIEVGRLPASTGTVAAGANGDITWQWDPQKIATGVYTLQAVVSIGETYYNVAPAEVTVRGICRRLTIDKTGIGAVPVASPARSAQCDADGRYVAGELIQLSGANPGGGYEIYGWTGTDHDDWKTPTNEVTMPNHDHGVMVTYGHQPGSITVVNQVIGDAPVTDWQYSKEYQVDHTTESFTLPAGGGQESFPGLAVGPYLLKQEPKNDYGTHIDCGNPASPISIGSSEVIVDLAPGEAVTCTFTNEQGAPPAIEVVYNEDWIDVWTDAGTGVSLIVEDPTGAQKVADNGTADGDGRFHWESDGSVDVVPGDVITAEAHGVAATIDPIGVIEATIDMYADSVSGTIAAPWFGTVDVWCTAWTDGGSASVQALNIAGDGGAFRCAFSSLLDIQGDDEVWVGYHEADGDRVIRTLKPPLIIPGIPIFLSAPVDAPITVDLTPYEQDQEDTETQLDWYVAGNDRVTVTGERSDDDILTFTPDTGYDWYDFVTLHLVDSVGLEDTQLVRLGWSYNEGAIAAGDYHSCALTRSGAVKCWGRNHYGQLGDGTTVDSPTLVDVVGLGGELAAISTGRFHSCALTTSGGVKCWGHNAYGQLGDDSTTDRRTPVDVNGLSSGVSAIVAGDYHTCALTTSGEVMCWGRNDLKQLGDGSLTNRLTPVIVPGLDSGSGIDDMAAGYAHTCVMTMNGQIKCWGYNKHGQLGDGSMADRLAPVDVAGLGSAMRSITAGDEHTCAVTQFGGVMCWGLNNYGQLGNGTTTDSATPVDVGGLDISIRNIVAGNGHACARTSRGGVKCWGANSFGQLGDGSTVDSGIPVGVSGLGNDSDVKVISAGDYHVCAHISDNDVKCWGHNVYGQLGDGTVIDSSTPVSTEGLNDEIGTVYLTPTVKATVNGVTYEDEDIVAYDGNSDTWSLFFDGSDVGLKSAKLNAFYILDDGTLLMSFHKAMKTLPGLEGIQVDDSDIVRFWPESLGADTAGFFEMYFDGSDVELTTGGEDIDAISFDENGKLIISTLSNGKVGALRFGDEDLLRFAATSLGDDTAGTWELYFDGSDIDKKLGDIAGSWIDRNSGDILFSVTPRWAYVAGGLTTNTYDIARCTPATLGEDSSCTAVDHFWNGANHGFGTSKHKIDGLHIGTAAYELPTICYRLNVGHSGWGVDPVVAPVKSVDCAEDGRYVAGEIVTLSEADAVDGWDIVGWTGTDNDASIASLNQVTMPAANHSAQVNYGFTRPIFLSPRSAVTVDGVRYEDEDILKYESDAGTWSLYFDGSDVGLASKDVNGFYLEQSGDLLLTLDKATSDLNGLGGVWDDSDIVRFTPTRLGDTTAGTFAMFFDGSDVGLTTGGEDIDAIAFDASGNLVISTTGSGKAGTLPMADEDLLRFNAASLGETTAGTWEMYFDGSDIDKKLSDISGSWIDAATGNILFAVDKKWVYGGLTANTYDILSCEPGSLGTDTSCTSVNFFWQGVDHAFGSSKNKIDGLSLRSD